jgi:methyltransferase (TIGR00027 family)
MPLALSSLARVFRSTASATCLPSQSPTYVIFADSDSGSGYLSATGGGRGQRGTHLFQNSLAGVSLNYGPPHSSFRLLTKSEVATTALFVAAVRARENERGDRLFRDELSSLLAGPDGLAWLAAAEARPGGNYHRDSFPYLETRTRFFDDWLSQAVLDSGAKQLVLLGAGMDTRAFRLPWPDGFRFMEVDTRELFALKESRLQSSGVRLDLDRVLVEADLASRDWVKALLDSGLRKDRPVVWLAEGLFQYLAAAVVKQILESAASVSSSGSRFGAEMISEDFLRKPSKQATLQRRKDRGTPWVFGTNHPEALLRSHGWAVDTKVSALEAAIALGRWPAIGARSSRARSGPPGATFISATKSSKRVKRKA